jgi:hypothetical protein
MAALVAAAFSWDFARVATRSLGDLPPEDFGWGWHLSGDDHNDVAHGVTADARAAAAMGDSVAAPMAQLAHRVLEQIPDSDGRSQMAHTLIVWARETRDGWHGHQNRNAVTAGGAGRGDTGRHLRFADRASSPFLLALPDGTSSGGDGPTGTCGSACPRGWGSPMASSA